MTILNPNNTNHEIKIIPRFYAAGDVLLELQNEENKTVTALQLPQVTANGYMYIVFTQTFADNSSYRVKVIQAGEIVYRGKLFVTSQADLQNYQISKDVFVI